MPEFEIPFTDERKERLLTWRGSAVDAAQAGELALCASRIAFALRTEPGKGPIVAQVGKEERTLVTWRHQRITLHEAFVERSSLSPMAMPDRRAVGGAILRLAALRAEPGQWGRATVDLVPTQVRRGAEGRTEKETHLAMATLSRLPDFSDAIATDPSLTSAMLSLTLHGCQPEEDGEAEALEIPASASLRAAQRARLLAGARADVETVCGHLLRLRLDEVAASLRASHADLAATAPGPDPGR